MIDLFYMIDLGLDIGKKSTKQENIPNFIEFTFLGER